VFWHRRRSDLVQVARQECGGERAHHIRQQQDRREREQQHGEHLARENAADVLGALEVHQQSTGNRERGREETRADEQQHHATRGVRLAGGGDTGTCDRQLRAQQVPHVGLTHAAPRPRRA
jgi:hypothetical protein